MLAQLEKNEKGHSGMYNNLLMRWKETIRVKLKKSYNYQCSTNLRKTQYIQGRVKIF